MSGATGKNAVIQVILRAAFTDPSIVKSAHRRAYDEMQTTAKQQIAEKFIDPKLRPRFGK
jgi:hypothetical protein